MAQPETLDLTPLTNKFDRRIFSFTHPIALLDLGDSFADIKAIYKPHYHRVLIQIHNTGANDMDFELYGSAEEASFAAGAPDFATGKYTVLPNSAITIAAGATATLTVTDLWNWILMRGKRTGAGLDTTANIYLRGL